MIDSTIFVAVASYCDSELIPTITDLLIQARRPERVTVGICVQSNNPGDLEKIHGIGSANQIHTVWFDYRHSRGACWARSEAHRLWECEEYVLNIDSHMRFAQNWDETLLDMIDHVPSSKAIISTYPAPYYPPNTKVVATPKIVANGFFRGGIVRLRGQNCSMRKPMVGAFIAGGFFFVHCRFLKEVPYDPNLYFIGEEHSLSVRAFSHGWDVFVPNKCILYHHYRDSRARRHWDESETWLDRHATSLDRTEALLGLSEPDEQLVDYEVGGRFGLGSDRSLKQFESHSGVYPTKRHLDRKSKAGDFSSCRARVLKNFKWIFHNKKRRFGARSTLP